MNNDERIAESYLQSCGLNPQFEPGGNVPPDFLVNSNIAVEVRRLDQQYVDGNNSQGIEDQRYALIGNLKRELSKCKSVPGGKCYAASFTFARPIPTSKEVKRRLDIGIKKFEAQYEALPFTWVEFNYIDAISHCMTKQERAINIVPLSLRKRSVLLLGGARPGVGSKPAGV